MPRKRYDLDLLNTPVETIDESITREYPPPVKEPCNDCPWRRNAKPGWLGPYEADLWLDIIHGESPIACHQTIPEGGGWGENTQQCRGAAIFRANVFKNPRNASIETGPRDGERIFETNDEFKDHHDEGRVMDPEQELLTTVDEIAEQVIDEAERHGISAEELLSRVSNEVKTRADD